MNEILIKDREGIEREVTTKAFELVGADLGWKIMGPLKPAEGQSEIQKAIAEKRAEKAAKDLETKDEKKEEVKEKVKPGPKPKTV